MKMPAGVIMFHPGSVATIPANWTRKTAIDGRFIKAWGTEDPNTQGGANTHSHAGITHQHSETDSHGHYTTYNTAADCSTYSGVGSVDAIAQCNHGHAASTITTRSGGLASDQVPYPTSANNNRPPYFDFVFIEAGSGGAVIDEGTVGLLNSATVPDNWLACTDGLNGAPALGNTYARGADTGQDGATTGGSLTHQHDLSHSHSTSHSHTGTTGNDDNHPDRDNQTGTGGNKTNLHTHPVTLDATTVTTDTYSGSVTSGTVEPVYKKLLAIQRQTNGSTGFRGLIALYMSATGLPKGWQLCDGSIWPDGVNYTPDMRNYYLKFANDTSEIGSTGGSNTHAHAASNSHSHSQSGTHNHTGSTGAAGGVTHSGGSTSPGSHTHTLASVGNNSATLTWDTATMSAESVNNEPEYLTAAFIQLTKIYKKSRMLEI